MHSGRKYLREASRAAIANKPRTLKLRARLVREVSSAKAQFKAQSGSASMVNALYGWGEAV